MLRDGSKLVMLGGSRLAVGHAIEEALLQSAYVLGDRSEHVSLAVAVASSASLRRKALLPQITVLEVSCAGQRQDLANVEVKKRW